MDFKRVAIIGADCISVSIALGLKAQKEPPEIIGYDTDAVAADLARARGAFDQVERKPGRACRDADLVIVAVPLTRLRETLATIAPHLQPGCLVTDTAYLKAPVLRWAEELLPEGVFFAGLLVPNGEANRDKTQFEIRYGPFGLTTAALIVLKDNRGKMLAVKLDPVLGNSSVEVPDPDLLAKLGLG